MTLRVITTVFAYILFAAHLSRHHLDPLAVVALLMPLLFLVKKRWAIKTLEYVLYLAAVSWIFPVRIPVEKYQQGDWLYFVIIGAVIVYTINAALMLRSRKITERYK